MNEEIKNKLTERFNSAYGEEVKIGLRDALRKVYLDGAEHGYQYALQHPQWIPVEERLPEHCDCLLYTEPRNIHGPFEGRFRFGFYNYADQRWEIQGEKWDNTIVTHWMPLPQPPRKEDDNA